MIAELKWKVDETGWLVQVREQNITKLKSPKDPWKEMLRLRENHRIEQMYNSCGQKK